MDFRPYSYPPTSNICSFNQLLFQLVVKVGTVRNVTFTVATVSPRPATRSPEYVNLDVKPDGWDDCVEPVCDDSNFIFFIDVVVMVLFLFLF
jgi:hypothetical protein